MDSLPPATAPTPEGGSPIIQERDLPAPPPVAGNDGRPFQIWGRTHPLNNQTSYQSNDAVSYGDNESLFGGWEDGELGTASSIYDLIQDDDGYVLSDSILSGTNENPTIVCTSECTKTLSRSDSVILAKYASSCMGIHCTICKGSSSQLRNPE